MSLLSGEKRSRRGRIDLKSISRLSLSHPELIPNSMTSVSRGKFDLTLLISFLRFSPKAALIGNIFNSKNEISGGNCLLPRRIRLSLRHNVFAAVGPLSYLSLSNGVYFSPVRRIFSLGTLAESGI